MKARLLWPVLLVGVCVTASAQTILVYVEEAQEGTPATRGVIRDGVHAALFQMGNVFFDARGDLAADVDWATGTSPVLERTALEGGATHLLLVRARTTYAQIPKGRIDVSIEIRILRLRDYGSQLIRREHAAFSNQGREDTVDAPRLGGEVGTGVGMILGEALRPLAGASR